MAPSTASSHGANRISLGAALLTALAASSCCIGPLVLAALGLGGAGVFARVSALRPIMLLVTGTLLGIAFYLSYRRPKATADACGCAVPKDRRTPRILLWVATVVTVLLATSPSLLLMIPTRGSPDLQGRPVSTVTIHVAGIDCEACAVPIRKTLAAAGGFDDVRLDGCRSSPGVS